MNDGKVGSRYGTRKAGEDGEEEEEKKEGSEENKEENYLLNTDHLFLLICSKCSSHMQDCELL